MVLRDATPVAFVPTADLERSRAFYVDVLGLEPLEDTPFGAVVAAGPVTVRLTPVPEVVPASGTLLGWLVADVHDVLAALAGRGVVPLRFAGFDQDDAGVWRAPDGTAVAWFADPDGHTLSLTGTDPVA